MDQFDFVYATDGSAGGRPGSGWAWVCTDGRYASGTIRAGDALSAELAAMVEAITGTPTGARVLVLSDSKPAIGMATETLSTGVIRNRTGKQGAAETAKSLHRLHLLGRTHTVSWRWIKAHNGHPLNTAADRICLQTRRCVQHHGVLDSLRPLFDRIVAETLGFNAEKPLAA